MVRLAKSTVWLIVLSSHMGPLPIFLFNHFFSASKAHMLRHSDKCKHTHTFAISATLLPQASINLLLEILLCMILCSLSHDTSSPIVSLLARARCIFRIIKGGQHVGHRGLSDVICWVCSYERLSKHLSANHHSNPQAVVPFFFLSLVSHMNCNTLQKARSQRAWKDNEGK